MSRSGRPSSQISVLRGLIDAARLTNSRVAEAIGVHPSTIDFYTSGARRVSYERAVQIRDLLADSGVSCTIDSIMAIQCPQPSHAKKPRIAKLGTGARWMVRAAIADGLIPSLIDGNTPCTDCGKPADRYDHRNYAEPLNVDPVCAGCNALRGPAVVEIKRAA